MFLNDVIGTLPQRNQPKSVALSAGVRPQRVKPKTNSIVPYAVWQAGKHQRPACAPPSLAGQNGARSVATRSRPLSFAPAEESLRRPWVAFFPYRHH